MKRFLVIFFCWGIYISCAQTTINREVVVKRHNVHISKADSLSSLTVGNGQFAFTVDVTGMQSFPDYYTKGVPLGTQSEWGWHSFPNKNDYRFDETLNTYDLEGRSIPYPVQIKEPIRNKEAVEYFRVNPHRLQLGNIGLEIKLKNGLPIAIGDLKDIHQELDLWTGVITSNFTIEGEKVSVITVCHPLQDAVSFRIISPLIKENRLAVRIRFPYPNGQFKDTGGNWSNDEKHQSVLTVDHQAASIKRILDETVYYTGLRWSPAVMITEQGKHYYLLKPAGNTDTLELSCSFSDKKGESSPVDFSASIAASEDSWKEFWLSGGAVDFNGSKDPRAFELERRIVLSQYLMRAQEASAFPPQETGLTFNSWYGRPHLEMHWWHAVHWALWGRPELLEKSLDWYFTVAEKAKQIAKRQGFDGLRWQKMTDHEGGEAPSSVGSFLIWQQPHFIYMAELLYRNKMDKAVLNKYKDLLFATAAFMASYPSYQAATGKYNLGRGLIPAQECFDALTTYNPTYELAYWCWALQKAQEWKERLGLPRVKKWDEVIRRLAPLPQAHGLYLATESTPDCYETGSRYLTDHPAVLGAFSSIPAVHGLEKDIMKHTLDTIMKIWQWNDTWGWDFPLTAMTATRLNMPDVALKALFMPVQKNTYLVNGHNYQDARLTIYMPGNGGLLSAVAMMCAGYDGCTQKEPGFPKDGSWKVKWEGLNKIF